MKMDDTIKLVAIDTDDVNEYFEHHGILGMHWGQRRYQDSDGTWTEEGLSRRRKGLIGRIGDTAKKASNSISTTARKKFNPTEADLDEQIAKAKEKQRITEKKKELAEIQGKNKRIKDMTDAEVRNEIQSRRDRNTLEELRRENSKIEKGKNFAKGTANVMSVPLKALYDIAGETAAYGIKAAGKTAIDTALENAKKDAIKKHQYDTRTKSEKLRDEANDARNRRDIENIEFEDSMRDVINETTKWQLSNERDRQRMARTVIRGEESDSNDAYDRLERYKNVMQQKKKG